MVWKLVGEGSPSFDKKNTTGGHFPQFRTKKRLKGPCKYNAPSLVWGRKVGSVWVGSDNFSILWISNKDADADEIQRTEKLISEKYASCDMSLHLETWNGNAKT